MPRKQRVKGQDCIYHVMIRGNDRQDIFISDNDRYKFIDILRDKKLKFNFKLYGYCLMDNHVHLLIDCNGQDISEIMKSININYAMYFNYIYKRIGHLFQDRFKSEVIDSHCYLLEASRYIHNNPVKAGMIKSASDYKWSSYNSYIGFASEKFVDTTFILSSFSADNNSAIIRYAEYVNSNICGLIKIIDTTNDHIQNVKMFIINKCLEISYTNNDYNSDIKYRNELIKNIAVNSYLTHNEIGNLFGGLSKQVISKIIKSG